MWGARAGGSTAGTGTSSRCQSEAAVAGQKRGLEIAGQTDEDFLRRAELTQGPPKAAHVGSCPQRHLLAKQTAEEWDAFRQNFACPPDEALLLLGGGRRPCASARRSGGFVEQLLETADFHAAARKHVRRNHAPCSAALWATEALDRAQPLTLDTPEPGVASVAMKRLAPVTLAAIQRCTGAVGSVQRGLVDLHLPPINSRRRTARQSPPCSPSPGGAAALRAFRLRLKALRSAALPGDAPSKFRASPAPTIP